MLCLEQLSLRSRQLKKFDAVSQNGICGEIGPDVAFPVVMVFVDELECATLETMTTVLAIQWKIQTVEPESVLVSIMKT